MLTSCSKASSTNSSPSPMDLVYKAMTTSHIDFVVLFLGSMHFLAVEAHSKWVESLRITTGKTIEVLHICLLVDCQRF